MSAHVSPGQTVEAVDLLTIGEAANELRIHERTLFRLIARCDLAVVRVAGRTLIERREIRRFVAERTQPAKASGP